MMFSRQREALVWFAGPIVHVVLCQKNWQGQWEKGISHAERYGEGTRLWYQDEKLIPEVVSKICRMYGLSEYRVSLVVGGPELSLKPVRLPSRQYNEALFMAAWDHSQGVEIQQQAFDVAYMEPDAASGKHKWMTVSYPGLVAAEMLQAFYREKTFVRIMEAVPAVAGRFFSNISGTVLLQDGAGFHLCELNHGHPDGYKWLFETELEAAGILPQICQWIQRDGAAVLILEDEKEVWQEIPPPALAYQQKMSSWNLTYPEAILTSML